MAHERLFPNTVGRRRLEQMRTMAVHLSGSLLEQDRNRHLHMREVRFDG
jgi:hypothetical protein